MSKVRQSKKALNDISFLRSIVSRLSQAGVPTVVFGGWAEELAGVIAPRAHKDVDLLFVSLLEKLLRRVLGLN